MENMNNKNNQGYRPQNQNNNVTTAVSTTAPKFGWKKIAIITGATIAVGLTAWGIHKLRKNRKAKSEAAKSQQTEKAE